MARTLFGVTFNRFAASAVVMSFTVESIRFGEILSRAITLLTYEILVSIVAAPTKKERAGKCY